jgi:transcriptional regulator with XRE-family HTH domain
MKLERSKAWWISKAAQEGDSPISAGGGAIGDVSHAPANADEERIAFGMFVRLMRRRKGMSVERLAEEAQLDVSEILIIEDDHHHVPEPRTVFQLARTFQVAPKRLMQLAGLASANDDRLRKEAIRFAARAESVEKLTPDQKAALEAFVAVLAEHDPNKAL